MIEIHESYKSFVPPPWFRPTVERRLVSLPMEHVGSMKSVILTDSRAIGRGKTRRVSGRRYDRNACRGFYHQEWRGQPARIQLVADNILSSSPLALLRLQYFRDQEVAEVLYHEVGHHLHFSVGSAARGDEEAAEYWRRRLFRIHFRRRCWYLRPVFLLLRPIVLLVQRTDDYRKYVKGRGDG